MTIRLSKENFRYQVRTIKWKTKDTIKDIIEWCEENPEITVCLVGVVSYAGKNVIKRINLNKQESVKALYCYDNKLGHYWRLKRPLSNREWLEIDRRKRAGECLSDILYSMRVLK